MGWIIQNNKLTNTEFTNMPDEPFHGGGPYSLWRIDPNANNGLPFVKFMIGVPVLHENTSNIYLGDQRVSKFYFGDVDVLAMYYGDDKVY